MYFAEHPTNTAARASSGQERTRWRDEGVDPELVADPFDVLAARQAEQARAQTMAERPLSAAVAAHAMEGAGVEV